MRDEKDFYILGIPVDTEIGKCEFIKVKEYPDHFANLQYMSLSKESIVYKYHEMNKTGKLTEAIEQLKQLSLFEIVVSLDELVASYISVFNKVFGSDDIIKNINNENFDYYRKLVLNMNCVKEDKANPNPEIQKWIEKSKRLNSDGNDTSFADMVTSIVGFNGLSYKDINDMTVYQLYMTFYRIAQIKGYDTSTLFATVSADKIQIESWSKHIDLLKEEQFGISRNEFNSTTKEMFD